MGYRRYIPPRMKQAKRRAQKFALKTKEYRILVEQKLRQGLISQQDFNMIASKEGWK